MKPTGGPLRIKYNVALFPSISEPCVTITEYTDRQPKKLLYLMGAFLLIVVAAGDYLTHTNLILEFSPLYVIPVSFFAWFAGKRAGIFFAAASVSLAFAIRLRHIQRLTAVWDALLWLALYFGTVFILVQLRKLYERERHLSRIDPLTRIENRRALRESADRARSYSERQGLPLSIAFLDLDGFKVLNDKLGHRIGDKLLALTAAVIRKFIRPTDTVARVGGDEFVILLPATTSEDAAQILHRVRHNFEVAMQNKRWPVTISVGLVTFSPPLSSVKEMIQHADAAMYAAKSRGRNQFEQRGA